MSSRRAISIAGRRGQLDELDEGYSALQRITGIYARLARVAVPEVPFKPAPPHATLRPRRASSCSGLGRWLELLEQIR